VSADDEPRAPQRAYSHLVNAADRAVRAGRIQCHDPTHVAAQFWSILHGYGALEMAGHFDQLDGFTQVFMPMCTNLLIGLGADPERLADSAAHLPPTET
jgi:Tetracyclin repressor-like, C-terminal domain